MIFEHTKLLGGQWTHTSVTLQGKDNQILHLIFIL